MIPFDFEYYRPDTVEEATDIYDLLREQGKKVIYYSGGTEIISRARVNELQFDVAIDIKQIPECNALGISGNKIRIGSAVTLTRLRESNIFPFLGDISRNIADHTARNQITVGGNICGDIPYREAVLPLLLLDSDVVIAGSKNTKTVPLIKVFDRKPELKSGDLIVQIMVDKQCAEHPYHIVRRTKSDKVDYPLITVASVIKDGKLLLGFSGLCSYPFALSLPIEEVPGRSSASGRTFELLMESLPDPIISDVNGSAEYRKFVLRNALEEVLHNHGGYDNVASAQ